MRELTVYEDLTVQKVSDMSTNPEIISRALNNSNEKLHRWNQQLRSAVKQSHYQQLLGEENYSRTLLQTQIITNQVNDDSQSCSVVNTRLKESERDVDEVNSSLLSEKLSIQNVFESSKQTLDFWQIKLKQAKEWLLRAQEWLENALQDLEIAQSHLRAAISEYEAAQRALRRCQNNDNRSECNAEVKRVNRAVDAINYCKGQVNLAKAEVEKAALEVKKAQAQVALCEEGVRYSTIALGYSEEATADITEAENISQQNFGHLKSASVYLEDALRKMKKNIGAIDDIQKQQITLSESVQNSKTLLVDIEKTEEVLNRTTYLTQKTINEKVHALIEFDRVIPLDTVHKSERLSAKIPPQAPLKNDASEANNLLPYVIALPALLRSVPGWANREQGKIGEKIAAKILQQTEGIHFVEITDSTGVDVKGISRKNKLVCAEVKTSIQKKQFEKFLTPGHGFREMSDGWLQHYGINPGDAILLGVYINPDKNTVTIFEREDAEATSWKCILSETPLNNFLE